MASLTSCVLRRDTKRRDSVAGLLRADTCSVSILRRVSTNHTKTDTSGPQRTRTTRWGQLDLALVELARLDREITSFLPMVRDAADREHLRSLEACRDALYRLVARHLDVAQA